MAEVVERVANLEARFDAQVVQLNGIQESIVRLEDKMERRFEGVDQRFQAFERRMDEGFAVVRTEFRWIIGAIAGAAVTVIVTILGALFAKDVIGLP